MPAISIREDTAKYLLNLDVNSAYYDPKTRAMHENPLPIGEDSKVRWASEMPLTVWGIASGPNRFHGWMSL